MRKCNYKGIKRIITYILILSMMASVFCINVSADDEDYSTYLSTYAARYFHFLHSEGRITFKRLSFFAITKTSYGLIIP